MPKNFKTDSYVAGLKFKGESKPKSKLFKWTTQFRAGLPKVTDDLALWTNWTINCGSAPGTATGSIIAQFQKDYNFGVVGGIDIRSKEVNVIDVVGTA